jgi:membrane protein DedA with SNARE-associated domain
MLDTLKEYLAWAADVMTTFTLAHADWAPAIIFALGYAESLAVVSLLVPSTIILLALGAIIAVGDLPLLPLIAAAAIGAFFGDWTSYAIGRWFKRPLLNAWPLRTMPEAVARTERLFGQYGWLAYFCGRFIGPLRAVFPLFAGIMNMRFVVFQGVNAASAIAWAGLVLGGGALLGESFNSIKEWL